MSPNYGSFPFPKDLFLKFVRQHNGYFPVKIQTLPEGTCVHVHTPVYQVGRDDTCLAAWMHGVCVCVCMCL